MPAKYNFRKAMSTAATGVILASLISGCATRPRASADVGLMPVETVQPGQSPGTGSDTVAANGAAGNTSDMLTAPPGTFSSGTGSNQMTSAFRSVADAQNALEQQTGDRVYFDFDSVRIRPDAAVTLQQQAAFLSAHRNIKVLVAGNADERGTREYNLALGARRAAATRDYLIALGIAPSRISTVSYGKERPIDPRPNEAGWARNRNAHSIIVDEGMS